MQSDVHALTRAMRTEAEALTEFITLLHEEQQALMRGNLERLASFAESKAIILFELNRLGDQRRHALSSHGMTPDRAGMQKLLRDRGAVAGSEADVAWRKLLELAATAQHLNETNGNLIRTRLSGTQQALNVLFSAANVMIGTYTSDGGTTCYRAPQQLAVA